MSTSLPHAYNKFVFADIIRLIIQACLLPPVQHSIFWRGGVKVTDFQVGSRWASQLAPDELAKLIDQPELLDLVAIIANIISISRLIFF